MASEHAIKRLGKRFRYDTLLNLTLEDVLLEPPVALAELVDRLHVVHTGLVVGHPSAHHKLQLTSA